MLDKKCKEKQMRIVVTSITRNFNRQNIYAIRYFICELLNFLNVWLQMYLINRFLDGEFMYYGSDVWSFLGMDQNQRTDPMITIFPKIAKCTFYEYGTSGSIQKIDGKKILNFFVAISNNFF